MNKKKLATVGLVILPFLFLANLAQCKTSQQNATIKEHDILFDITERNAKKRIITIVEAIESYAADNEGVYPQDLNDLTEADPPYLVPDFYATGVEGYQYSITFELNTYKIAVIPVECGKTGNKMFIQENGKELFEQACQESSL